MKRVEKRWQKRWKKARKKARRKEDRRGKRKENRGVPQIGEMNHLLQEIVFFSSIYIHAYPI